jgi:glucose uptake protein GlcU
MKFENKRLALIIGFIALILLIPFTAMQFASEVKWTAFDFTIAAALLITIGLACELVLRKVKTKKNRIIICLGLLLLLAIIWVELAVGIF